MASGKDLETRYTQMLEHDNDAPFGSTDPHEAGKINRTIWFAVGGTAVASLFVGGAFYVGANQAPDSPKAEATASPFTRTATPSITETSDAPSPQATTTAPHHRKTRSPIAAHSPTHIPSPSATTSHRVVRTPKPHPTPTHTETTPSHQASACQPNPNVSGEIICTSPVPAYTSETSTDVEFEINGATAVDCRAQTAGRVLVSISNDKGWADLSAIGNPC